MKLFGLTIRRTPKQKQAGLQAVYGGGRSWFTILDSTWAGAWQQRSTTMTNERCVLAHSAVFACVTVIASDIGKLSVKLRRQFGGIWQDTDLSTISPVLSKPNHYQTSPQFWECWVYSRLLNGNSYVLKERDAKGKVSALYILDPARVTPLVAADGGVYYQLADDTLSGIDERTTVPATEIIHDRCNTIFHPLVGISPITACAWSASLGVRIAQNSKHFFENASRPSGILTAPGTISKETAEEIKTSWQSGFTGRSSGKVAVLGDGMKFDSMTVAAHDSQLIEQLQWTAVDVARAFRVPAFMIGAGALPAGLTTEALTQLYYSQVLQSIIESIERALDHGLELPDRYGTEFDLDALLRMDTASRYKSYSDAVGGGWMAPNEARAKEDLPSVSGGDSCYLQQQNFSLEALSKRDAKADPFAGAVAANGK